MKTKLFIIIAALCLCVSAFNLQAQNVENMPTLTTEQATRLVQLPYIVTTTNQILNLLPPLPAAALTPAPSITGGIGEILKSVGLVTDPTNYAGAIFYGRSLHGNQSAVGLLVIENVNNNLGVIAGVDTLWGGGKVGSANIVAGGLSLKEATHPLAFIGGSFATNFTATPYAIAMVGTPLNGTGSADGGLASIARAGINLDVYNFKGFELGAGVDYGKRNGAGLYSGDWLDFEISIRKGF